MGVGREGYVDLLLKRGPKNEFHSPSEKEFYLAYNGDKPSFLRFLKSKDQDIAGEPGEGWIADTVVLILRYDDPTLHDYLLCTDAKERNYVCYILDSQLLPEDKQRYPETMSLYDPKPFHKQ